MVKSAVVVVDTPVMTEIRGPHDAGAVVVAWLTHPVTCVALVVLLVNDHVFKAAWGNALTGKLSDFAWLLVAPPLLATFVVLAGRALRIPLPQPGTLVAVSLGATGAVFAVVKLTVAGAAACSAVLSAVAGPSVVLRDPSDLIALPMLWLGWHVALRRGAVLRSHGAGTGWRWLVVLPLAVLATAATSTYRPPGAVQLAVIDETLVVSERFGSEYLQWFVSADGAHWEQAESRTADDEITAKFLAAGGTLEEACVPKDPAECYRAGDGLGVDRSLDGGATWAADWAIPEDVREELAERYRPRGDWLGTTGVAIFPTASGFQVWAVNRGDGLAVRHEDGSWERLGFSYRSEPPAVVPLPGEPTEISYPVVTGLPLGVIAASLVLLLGAAGLPRRLGAPRVRGGTVLVVAGVGAAVVAAVVNGREGAVQGQEVASGVIFGSGIIPATVVFLVVLGIGLVVGGAVMLGRQRSVGPMAFAVMGVVLAAEASSPVLAAAISVTVVIAAAVVARRLDARPAPEPAFPTDYWA